MIEDRVWGVFIPKRLKPLSSHWSYHFPTTNLFGINTPHTRSSIILIHLPMRMEPTESSETSAINVTWTPGTYPKDKKLQLEHGESLKSRISFLVFQRNFSLGDKPILQHLLRLCFPGILSSYPKKCNFPFLISEIISGTLYRSVNGCLNTATIWGYEIISSFYFQCQRFLDAC
jgi:hypothetical protein